MSAPWADITAVEQTLYRYVHALDRGSLDDVMALFSDDAVLVVETDDGAGRHEGAAAIRAWLTTHHFERAGRIRNMRHKVASPMVDIAGDTADVVAYFDADGVDTATGRGRVTAGRYEDRLVRVGDGWRIAERRLVFLDRHHFARD